MKNRLDVPESQYTSEKVQLPPANEIPNVDLQVINFHRPIFGTFHAKFTVIDRHIALLQSSNIQDNDNLEMLAHISGPIVDAFYDAALLSWGKALDPPLPLLDSQSQTALGNDEGENGPHFSVTATSEVLSENNSSAPPYDNTLEEETQRVNSSVHPRGEESLTQAVSRHLSKWSIEPLTD